LGGQLQFSERGFPHPVVIVRKPTDEAAQTEMA
jgi:hypothetical protein